MVLDPMPGNIDPAADPHVLRRHYVVEKPLQARRAAGAPEDNPAFWGLVGSGIGIAMLDSGVAEHP